MIYKYASKEIFLPLFNILIAISNMLTINSQNWLNVTSPKKFKYNSANR